MSGKILSLPGDGPVINCPPHDGPWNDYFNENVACGDLHDQRESQFPFGAGWVKLPGCGARDWSARSTFWYPRPGKQFEITCNCCRRVFGVEVRVASVEEEHHAG